MAKATLKLRNEERKVKPETDRVGLRETMHLPGIAIPVRVYIQKSAHQFHVQNASLKRVSKDPPCIKLASTLLPVCSSGCPATICRNRWSPSRRCSMTSSLNRFVNTLPGRGGIVTRVLSRSRMSRKYSKSEYRRRTTECFSLNAGMLVRQTISYEVYMLRDVPWV